MASCQLFMLENIKKDVHCEKMVRPCYIFILPLTSNRTSFLFTFCARSQPVLLSEPQERHSRACHASDDGNGESPPPLLHSIDEVHAKHGGDEGWEKDNHVERSEQPHHRVHIIIRCPWWNRGY